LRVSGANVYDAGFHSRRVFFRPVSVLGPPGERVRFTYGYSRDSVLLSFGVLLAALAAPLAAVLVVRRRAFKCPMADPAAAWFGTWQFMRMLSTLIWIAWAGAAIATSAG